MRWTVPRREDTPLAKPHCSLMCNSVQQKKLNVVRIIIVSEHVLKSCASVSSYMTHCFMVQCVSLSNLHKVHNCFVNSGSSCTAIRHAWMCEEFTLLQINSWERGRVCHMRVMYAWNRSGCILLSTYVSSWPQCRQFWLKSSVSLLRCGMWWKSELQPQSDKPRNQTRTPRAYSNVIQMFGAIRITD